MAIGKVVETQNGMGEGLGICGNTMGQTTDLCFHKVA